MQWRPVASEVFTSSQHSSRVRAAGTSTATCLPSFMAATAMGVCQIHGVATSTRSTSSRFSRASKAWSLPWYRPIGPDAFPARSSLACVWSTFSFTVSHSAVTCTSGIAEKLSIKLFPRPPVPITPKRTFSFASNFIPRTLRSAGFAACGSGAASERPIPTEANDASRNRPRRDSWFSLILTRNVADSAGWWRAAPNHYGARDRTCVSGNRVRSIARPSFMTVPSPADVVYGGRRIGIQDHGSTPCHLPRAIRSNVAGDFHWAAGARSPAYFLRWLYLSYGWLHRDRKSDRPRSRDPCWTAQDCRDGSDRDACRGLIQNGPG